MAIRLLERRGVGEYIGGKISREQLARNPSKEWVALPRATGANPNASYYEGDGLNSARLSVDEMLVAIGTLKRHE